MSENVLKNEPTTYFTSVGAMLGGILAISFSLRMLLIQSAADKLSAGFFEIISIDNTHNIIYWVTAVLILILFGFALLFSDDHITFPGTFVRISYRFSFIAIGFSLWGLSYIFLNIRRRINPKESILLIRKEMLRSIQKIKRGGRTTNSQRAESLLISRFSFLFDYHDKLISSQERTTARLVMNTISDIFIEYLERISGSCKLIYDIEHFVYTSDSQYTLQPIFEGFEYRGYQYIRESDDASIRNLIDAFVSVAHTAKEIQYEHYDNVQRNENPIFSQCHGYLRKIIDFAFTHASITEEAVFQGLRAVGRIGKMSIEKGLTTDYRLNLEFLAFKTMILTANPSPVLFNNAVKCMMPFPAVLVKHYVGLNLQIQIKTFLDYFFRIMVLVNNSTALITESFRLSRLLCCLEGLELYRQVFKQELSDSLSDATSENTAGHRDNVLILCDEWCSSVRANWSDIEIKEYELANRLCDHISEYGRLLLVHTAADEWISKREKVLELVSGLVGVASYLKLGKNLAVRREAISLSPDCVAQIGLRAIELNEQSVAETCVDVIAYYCKTLLERQIRVCDPDDVGSIMARVCMIAILAKKKNITELQSYALNKIREFETSHTETYLHKLPEGMRFTIQPYDSVARLVTEPDTIPGFGHGEGAKNILLSLTSSNDIENYLAQTWPNLPLRR